MAIEGVDYSFGRPQLTELFRLGKRFAVRYVSWASGGRGRSVLDGHGNGKVLTRSEVTALRSAGLAIVTNWEFRHDDQLRGRAGGREDALEADRIHRHVGGPVRRPIYFSTDFDASSEQLKVCYEYLRGCADIIGWDRVGVYGGFRTIEFMRARNVRWLWQTYAWSGGRWADDAQLQQYRNGVQLAGADLDLDRAMMSDYGQWEQEEDVSYGDWPESDRRALASDVVNAWFRRELDRPWDQDDPTQRADQFLAWLRTDVVRTRESVTTLRGELAGLVTLVQSLIGVGEETPLSPEQFTQLLDAVRSAAREPGERLAAAIAAAGEQLTSADDDTASPVTN